jgi:hypothetical protein
MARQSNGEQMRRVAALAIKRGKSGRFTAYWKHVVTGA